MDSNNLNIGDILANFASSNYSNVTVTPSEDIVLQYLEYISYGLSFLIVVLFTCLERNWKGNRPGIVVPVDLLCDDRLVYAYTAAFGCASSSVLYLILTRQQTLQFLQVPDHIKPWVQIPIWLLYATIVAWKFYPIFAAIQHPTPVVGPVIGLLYCGYLFGEHIYSIIKEMQSVDQIVIVVAEIPILLCYLTLLTYFAYRNVHSIYAIVKDTTRNKYVIMLTVYAYYSLETEKTTANPHMGGYERQYVKWLLKNKETENTEKEKGKILSTFTTYKARIKTTLNLNTPYRTSPRVITTFVVCGIILIQIGILVLFAYPVITSIVVDVGFELLKNTTYSEDFRIFTTVTDVSFYVSFCTSSCVMAVYIVLIFRNYQKDMHRMYRGDFSFLPRKIRNREVKHLVTGSLRYSGTQIAYMFWCYIILLLVTLFICFFLAYLLVLPLLGKVSETFLIPAKAVLPFYVAKYLFNCVERTIVKRCFLQKKLEEKDNSTDIHRIMAVKNRKMFSVLNYFMFFFHVIIGLFGCLSRIFKGAAIGILTVARIDKSLLPRGYEQFDTGFSTYAGLLMLELYHRNPVVLVFCEELLSGKTYDTHSVNKLTDYENGYKPSVTDDSVRFKRTQIRNKWFKAITLINNASLRDKKCNTKFFFYIETSRIIRAFVEEGGFVSRTLNVECMIENIQMNYTDYIVSCFKSFTHQFKGTIMGMTQYTSKILRCSYGFNTTVNLGIAGNGTELSPEDEVVQNMALGGLGLAIIAVVILSFLERNEKGKAPGVVIPIDFFGDEKLVYAYTAAFGCTSYAMLILISSGRDLSMSFDLSPDVRPWVQVPIWLFYAVVTSFQFYPIFACIRHSSMAVGPLIGFLYCGYLLAQNIYAEVQIKRDLQGQGIYYVLIQIPILACYVILLTYFIYRGVKDILAIKRGSEFTNEIKAINRRNGYEYKYVKWILNRDNIQNEKEENGLESTIKTYQTKVKEKLNSETPLRTSTRVIVTFTVTGIILFQVGILICGIYNPIKDLAVCSLNNMWKNSTALPYLKTLYHVIDVSFYISLVTSTLIMVVYIVLIYRNYQKDVRKMYRGDFSFIPTTVRESDIRLFAAKSLRYSGTQIAYMFWCYLMMFSSILVICILLAYLIVLPLMGKVPGSLLTPAKVTLPLFLARFFFKRLQVYICGRYFLQKHVMEDGGDKSEKHVLALRNRKMFSVFTYFMFFFHVIIGFIGCLGRILKGAVIGIVTVARIDSSLLPSGYEQFDQGYTTYVGLIMLELYHRNPILVVFCDQLLTIQSDKLTDISLQAPSQNPGYQRSVSDCLNREKRIHLRNKWLKAFTLVNNPSLRELTKKRTRGFSEHYNNVQDISEA